MNPVRTALILALLLVVTAGAEAQDLKFFGQVRERTEFDGRSSVRAASLDAYHLLRTRLGMSAQLNSTVKAVIEVQDARYFGGEGNTEVKTAPAFDLRTGFIEASKLLDGALTLRLGRQQMAYANERLIGLGDWTNFGQAFDAGLARFTDKDVTVDVFGAGIARNSNVLANGTYAYVRDVFLTGVWAAWKPATVRSSLQAFYLYDNPKGAGGATGSYQQFRHTAGIYANGVYGDVDFEIDAAHQFGTIRAFFPPDNVTINASMAGVRAGYTMKDQNDLRLGVGLDYLTGSDPKDPKTYGAFSTMYGTKHKFFGFMDYFTNIPAQTASLGLMDMMIQASIIPDTDMKLGADFHLFNTASDPLDDATMAAADPKASKYIGMELDVVYGWKMFDVLSCQAGYSSFNGGANRVVLTGKKTTWWAYFMTSVTL